MTLEERFWAKVDKSLDGIGCWVWTGAPTSGRNCGYGRFSIGGRADNRMVSAHRFAYELLVGIIPDGLTIDHLCRNRLCVNPAHLEAVDNRTNILRGTGSAAQRAKVTHCVRGHLFDMFNTYIDPEGHRVCRHCRRLRQNAVQGRERWIRWNERRKAGLVLVQIMEALK